MQRSLVLFNEGIKSEHTRKIYHSQIDSFLSFTKIKDYDSLLELSRDQTQVMLEDYVIHVKKKVNPNTVPTMMTGVKHFFDMNDVMINWKKITKLYPEKIKRSGYRAWTSEEISKMISSTSDVRNKAILLFLSSTGARSGVFDYEMKIKHIKNMSDNCKSVLLYAGAKEEYWSFLTPEASNMLNEYWEKRKNNGEHLSPDSPIFRNEYRLGIEEAKQLRCNGLRMMIYRLVQKTKLQKTKMGKRYDVQIDHGFRKRFNVILKTHDLVNPNIAEKLMGHSVTIPLDNAYLPIDDPRVIEKCFEEFKKVIPELTIDGSERSKIQIENQNKKISELEEKTNRIEKLEQRMKQLEKINLDRD